MRDENGIKKSCHTIELANPFKDTRRNSSYTIILRGCDTGFVSTSIDIERLPTAAPAAPIRCMRHERFSFGLRRRGCDAVILGKPQDSCRNLDHA